MGVGVCAVWVLIIMMLTCQSQSTTLSKALNGWVATVPAPHTLVQPRVDWRHTDGMAWSLAQILLQVQGIPPNKNSGPDSDSEPEPDPDPDPDPDPNRKWRITGVNGNRRAERR